MIQILFLISAAVALTGAILTVTRHNAVHALLYFVVTMLAIALIFFLLGASFAAALQVIIYAGAIMVLFVFVTMMLHQGRATIEQEAMLFQPKRSLGAAALCLVLLLELGFLLTARSDFFDQTVLLPYEIGAKQIGLALFGPYLLLVELSALLLLSSLTGAFHIARRHQEGKLHEDKLRENKLQEDKR